MEKDIQQEAKTIASYNIADGFQFVNTTSTAADGLGARTLNLSVFRRTLNNGESIAMDIPTLQAHVTTFNSGAQTPRHVNTDGKPYTGEYYELAKYIVNGWITVHAMNYINGVLTDNGTLNTSTNFSPYAAQGVKIFGELWPIMFRLENGGTFGH